MNIIIEEKLKVLPAKPGVYIMKDNLDNVIYVGKAKILKNRVRQYFRKSTNHSNKVIKMVENIYDLNWIVTDSEIEALILECNLIKKHRPKYNILLKDDKTFPFIKVTTSEDYPRIIMTRKIDSKKDRFFGPFVSSWAVKNTIDLLRKTYGIRDCNKDFSKTSTKRECLNYHIKQCSSPCMGYISREDYLKSVNEAIDFLEGRSDGIIKKLTDEMKKASSELKFELAAEIRDRINHLNAILEKQKISVPKDAEYDIIGIGYNDRYTCITVMFVRNGKLLGSKNMYFGASEPGKVVLTDFLKQFYENPDIIPKEIIIPIDIEEKELIKELVSGKKGSGVIINYPLKGRKKELSEMACKNATEGLNQKNGGKFRNALVDLKELLGMEDIPERIEIYDISNTGGADIVGFMSVFENGTAKKSEYRKFKIKYTETQDDYDCMYEVIYRRLMHYLEDKINLENGEDPEKLKFINLPDLIFVDGGKGHVRVGREAVKNAGLNVEVFGLVKDNRHKTKDITSDTEELGCYTNRALFNLVSGMQDETHNQAVKYHHTLRTNNLIKSELLRIEGLGEATRKKLFDHFETLDNIKSADIESLEEVVNKKLAEKIYNFYHKESKRD